MFKSFNFLTGSFKTRYWKTSEATERTRDPAQWLSTRKWASIPRYQEKRYGKEETVNPNVWRKSEIGYLRKMFIVVFHTREILEQYQKLITVEPP